MHNDTRTTHTNRTDPNHNRGSGATMMPEELENLKRVRLRFRDALTKAEEIIQPLRVADADAWIAFAQKCHDMGYCPACEQKIDECDCASPIVTPRLQIVHKTTRADLEKFDVELESPRGIFSALGLRARPECSDPNCPIHGSRNAMLATRESTANVTATATNTCSSCRNTLGEMLALVMSYDRGIGMCVVCGKEIR